MATSSGKYVGIDVSKDRLDVAVFGQRVQPRRYVGKSEAEKQLSALLVRRKQVEEMLKAEQSRLRTVSPSLRGSLERMIAVLKEEKKPLDEEICGLMNEQQAWQEQIDLGQCSWGRCRDHRYAAGRLTRTGQDGPQESGSLGWCGTDEL